MSGVLRYVGKRVKRLHQWEADIGTQEWAEKNIYMHSDSSPLTGMLRFDDTPHLSEILADFDRSEVWKQLLNFSTQTGKTLMLQIAWAKAMCTDPARMQWTIRNSSDVPNYLEEKILPFIRGVKTLQDKILVLAEDKKKKQRAASMNIYGGGVTFTGITAAERRSKTVKYLFSDEIALYDAGNFLELEGRTKAFERHFRKIIAVSSRKRDGDEMDIAYETCELKKEWHTYCPNCEDHFYAKRKHFKFLTKGEFLAQKGLTEETFNLSQYKKEALKDVHVECPECFYHISNTEKDQNIFDKKYKFVIVDGDASGKTIGYMVNALAVRITSFETIADLLINAEDVGEHDTLSQLYIDYFNEFYTATQVTVGSSELLNLTNGLGEWNIPKDCYKIYMGVDTQKSNFWVTIQAFCYGNVSHCLWAGSVETFGELEDIWVHGQYLQGEDGNTWMISKMGIDRRGYNESGISRTDEVDSFVQYMVSKHKSGDEDRIYATEGHSILTGDRAVAIVNSRDMSNNRTKVDIKIVKMSNLYLKNVLSRAIQRSLTKATAQEGDEGYDWAANLFFINQDEIERDSISITGKSYTQQMTAESYDFARDGKSGKIAKVKSWVRVRKDNHLWDCTVICYAFAEIDKVSLAVKGTDTNMISALAGLY